MAAILQIYVVAGSKANAVAWKTLVHLGSDGLLIFATVLAGLGAALCRQSRIAACFFFWTALNIVIASVGGFGGARLRAPFEPLLVILAASYSRCLAPAAPGGAPGGRRCGLRRRHRRLPPSPNSLRSWPDYGIVWPSTFNRPAGQFTGAAGLNVPAFNGLATLTATSLGTSPAQFEVRVGGVHVRTMDVAPGETRRSAPAGRPEGWHSSARPESITWASGRQSRYACRDDDERNSVVGGIAESCGHRPRAGGRHHAVRRPAAARLVRRQVRHARPSRVGPHRDPDHRAARPGHPAAERALDARAQSLRRRRPHHLHPVRPGDAVLLPAARARAGVSRHGARRTVGTRRPGLRGQPGVSRGLDARHLRDLPGGRRPVLARRGPSGGAPDGDRARDGDVGRRRVARRYLHRHHSFLGMGVAQAARTAVARERPRRRRALWHLVPDENHRDHFRRAGVPVAGDRARLDSPAANAPRRSASPRQCSRSWSRLIS